MLKNINTRKLCYQLIISTGQILHTNYKLHKKKAYLMSV